jgi:hypothetical protein
MGGACSTYKTVEQEVLGRTKRLLSFDTTRAVYKTTRPTVLLFYVCKVEAEVEIVTDGQSVSLSWCRTPIRSP